MKRLTETSVHWADSTYAETGANLLSTTPLDSFTVAVVVVSI